MPCVHTFKYSRSTGSKNGMYDLRDETALAELVSVLCAEGEYWPGVQVFNQPPEEPPLDPAVPGALLQVDRTPFAQKDLIVVATRPPMDDRREGGKKQVERGYTDLEELMFGSWKRYLDTCSRSKVELGSGLPSALPENARTMACMEFRTYKNCSFKRLNDSIGGGWKNAPASSRETAVFLLRQDSLWEGGPGLVWAFGMDGFSTLTWCHRLATTEAYLLEHTGFTLARLEQADHPERPTDLGWAEESRLEVVLQMASPTLYEVPKVPAVSGKSAHHVQAKKAKKAKGKPPSKGRAGSGEGPKRKRR